MSNRAPHVLCHHLVGFFDVLGQSSKLRQLNGLPESEAQRLEMIRVLKETVGVVLGVRRMFRDFFGAFEGPTEFAKALSGPERELLMTATNTKVVYRGISDSFIVTVCLAETGLAPAPMSGVYRAFVAAAGMWLLALSVGHPIRGGIDVGLAIDIDDDEIYGPVLDSAYRLESRVAGGPRIVVGDGCVDYLRFVEARPPTDVHAHVASGMASWCLSMLRHDHDGVVTLDPLGDRMREISTAAAGKPGASIGDRVKPAHDVVRRQLADARGRGDTKLASRYEQLLNYFDERAGNWD
jgi:hypothetical protein